MIYALLFALQAAQPPAPPIDPRPAPWPDHERELRLAGALDRQSTPAARRELERWAGCIARKNPREAARVLTMDFTSGAYGRAMRMLSEGDKGCVEFRGALRTGGLLFAGEMAETLLETDPAPLDRRLALAAAAPATKAYSFTDKVAICVVRSVPSEVSKLFATARGSAEETAALNALATPMGLCAKAAKARQQLVINPIGLRAMLATASYRSVAGRAS